MNHPDDFLGFTPQQIHAGLTVPACLPADRQWPVEIAVKICPVFQAQWMIGEGR